MTSIRVLSTAFGLLMVAAVAVRADEPALVAAVVAAVAVLASIQFVRAATVAVIACVVAIALSDPNPMLATLAGLNATAYLLLRHAGARESLTRPTMVAVLGLVGFECFIAMKLGHYRMTPMDSAGGNATPGRKLQPEAAPQTAGVT